MWSSQEVGAMVVLMFQKLLGPSYSTSDQSLIEVATATEVPVAIFSSHFHSANFHNSACAPLFLRLLKAAKGDVMKFSCSNWLGRCWSTTDSCNERDKSVTSEHQYHQAEVDEFISPPKQLQFQHKKVDDHVYLVHEPEGRPSMEIVFFHGFQWRRSEKEIHFRTWMTRDGSECWLNWLREWNVMARISTVQFDASLVLTPEGGRMDRYLVAENVLSSLIGHNVGIGRHACPILLVGHCVGGLVLKEVCWQAQKGRSLGPRGSSYVLSRERFLRFIKGLVFFATPHEGLSVDLMNALNNGRIGKADMQNGEDPLEDGLLLRDLSALNALSARTRSDFSKLRQKFSWKTLGVGELHEVDSAFFKGLIVPEASARSDMDYYHSEAANHFMVSRPTGRDSSCYQRFVNFAGDILQNAPATLLSSCDSSFMRDMPNTFGLEDAVKGFVKQLEERKHVHFLGFVGMSGIGKTTLASQLYNAIGAEYDGTCFLEGVKSKVPINVKSDVLKKLILNNLKWKVPQFANMSWRELNGQSLLIVLDDVESEDQILRRDDCAYFDSKSCILLTSCKKNIFETPRLEITIHEVQLLDSTEATKLLATHGFGAENVPAEFEEVFEKMLNKCNGFPLALQVVGRFLRGREEETWDDALVRLEHAQSQDGSKNDPWLWERLRLPYDDLADVEQQMFLDVATCFHGELEDEVLAQWRARYPGQADSGWNNLKDRCLANVTKIQETEHHWVYALQMHEQLRDLGRRIVHEEYTHSRVWELSSLNLDMFHQEEFLRMKVRVMKLDNWPPHSTSHADIIQLFPNLEVLWLRSVCLGDYSNYFGRKLVSFSWTGLRWQLGSFFSKPPGLESDRTVSSHSLVHLNLRVSMSSFLTSGEEPKPLSTSPIFENVPSLQHLVLDGIEFQHLPELLCLRTLKLKGAYQLQEIPESFGLLSKVRILEIDGSSILRVLPPFLGNLTELRSLKLSNLNHIESIPDCFAGFRYLRHLDIGGCRTLKCLPDSLGNLRSLTNLSFCCLPSLTELPDLQRLEKLQKLQIARCRRLARVPEMCKGLQHLIIRSCPALTCLPIGFGSLKSLQALTISRCSVLSARIERLRVRSTWQDTRAVALLWPKKTLLLLDRFNFDVDDGPKYIGETLMQHVRNRDFRAALQILDNRIKHPEMRPHPRTLRYLWLQRGFIKREMGDLLAAQEDVYYAKKFRSRIPEDDVGEFEQSCWKHLALVSKNRWCRADSPASNVISSLLMDKSLAADSPAINLSSSLHTLFGPEMLFSEPSGHCRARHSDSD